MKERLTITCPQCRTTCPEKGRALDGRRAYRCRSCRRTWTDGLQGRARHYSEQRQGYQFADTGAWRRIPCTGP